MITRRPEGPGMVPLTLPTVDRRCLPASMARSERAVSSQPSPLQVHPAGESHPRRNGCTSAQTDTGFPLRRGPERWHAGTYRYRRAESPPPIGQKVDDSDPRQKQPPEGKPRPEEQFSSRWSSNPCPEKIDPVQGDDCHQQQAGRHAKTPIRLPKRFPEQSGDSRYNSTRKQSDPANRCQGIEHYGCR